MAGRKPLPTKLKILAGNPGKQKIPKGEPQPDTEINLDCPCPLRGYAREEWVRISKGLNALQVLSDWDIQTLAAYCVAYDRWRKAEEEIQKLEDEGGPLHAMILKTISGNYIQRPIIGISNKAASDMMRYAAEFGLTPSARARLAIDPGRKSKSKFSGLINVKKD